MPQIVTSTVVTSPVGEVWALLVGHAVREALAHDWFHLLLAGQSSGPHRAISSASRGPRMAATRSH